MAFEFLPRFAVSAPERVTFGPDAVPALLVRPDAPGPHPGAVIQHGYGAEKADLAPLAVFLAAYGFVSLLPDAWGHGERLPRSGPSWMTESSPDYFFEATRHTIGNVRDALTYMTQRPEVKADALLVGGFSMGAMVSLIVGTEDARVAGVVSIAGAPLPDLVCVPLFDEKQPSDAACQWAREHDAALHIDRLAPKPLVIAHGRADDMVPVAGALRLYEAAKPCYAAAPDHLALMLYDHTHTATPEQLNDIVRWIAPFFFTDDDSAGAAGDEGGDEAAQAS